MEPLKFLLQFCICLFLPGILVISESWVFISLRKDRFYSKNDKSKYNTYNESILHDAFILISDGLEERSNDAEEILGDEAIRQCIAKSGNKSADEIRNALVDLGEDWANGKPNEDDVTFVVVKRRNKHHAK